MSTTAQPQRRRLGPELLIEVPAVIVTFVMMLHVTANALLRAFANSPIRNTLEVVQYWYLPLLAFLGFVAAQHRAQHIAADLFYGALPRVTRRFVLAGGFLLGAVIALGLARFGWNEAMHAYSIKKTAGVSGLTSWPAYFLAPLAFGIMTAQFSWAAVRAVTHPEEEHVRHVPDEMPALEDLEESLEEAKGTTRRPLRYGTSDDHDA